MALQILKYNSLYSTAMEYYSRRGVGTPPLNSMSNYSNRMCSREKLVTDLGTQLSTTETDNKKLLTKEDIIYKNFLDLTITYPFLYDSTTGQLTTKNLEFSWTRPLTSTEIGFLNRISLKVYGTENNGNIRYIGEACKLDKFGFTTTSNKSTVKYNTSLYIPGVLINSGPIVNRYPGEWKNIYIDTASIQTQIRELGSYFTDWKYTCVNNTISYGPITVISNTGDSSSSATRTIDITYSVINHAVNGVQYTNFYTANLVIRISGSSSNTDKVTVTNLTLASKNNNTNQLGPQNSYNLNATGSLKAPYNSNISRPNLDYPIVTFNNGSALYIKWYTVTYNINGGTSVTKQTGYIYGVTNGGHISITV